MNHNEETPDFLGELGDMLPADVLKKVNELLEQLHRKDKDHQGSPVFIYAPGSQYVDNLDYSYSFQQRILRITRIVQIITDFTDFFQIRWYDNKKIRENP